MKLQQIFRAKERPNMKGQMTIIGLIMIMVGLFVLTAFAPMIIGQVAQLKNATANDTQAGNISTLADLILPLMVRLLA